MSCFRWQGMRHTILQELVLNFPLFLNPVLSTVTIPFSGWGLTGDSCSPYISTVLQEVEVSIVSDVVCEAASSTSAFNQSTQWGGCVTVPYWSYINQISSDMVCAGAAGKSPCHGDSGGPLTVKNALTKKHDLVGVVSWGSGCATVSCSWLPTTFFIFLLRMDCTGCMQRWPSTGLGLIELLLQMAAHHFALHKQFILFGESSAHQWNCSWS